MIVHSLGVCGRAEEHEDWTAASNLFGWRLLDCFFYFKFTYLLRIYVFTGGRPIYFSYDDNLSVWFCMLRINGTRDYESELIHQGIRDLDVENYIYMTRIQSMNDKVDVKQDMTTSKRKGMLCATFVRTTIFTASM